MDSLLIVDDDIGLCIMLRDYFLSQNISLAMCHDGALGLQTAIQGSFDLVILDVMLPTMDGFEILRHLRSASPVSILLLTSRAEDDSLIFGLENGADDYVPKPFNPRELLARIRSILRRRSHLPSNVQASRTSFEQNGFVLNPGARSAVYCGIPLRLTPVEFLLLEALIASPGDILSRDDLTDRVFRRSYNPMDRALDMLVSRLRRKLDVADNPGACIKTIRSEGYVFAPHE
jgi:two-component system response regulator CpxR